MTRNRVAGDERVKHKKVDYFMRRRDELLKRQSLIVSTFKTSNEKATEASYIVSYRIALAGAAHTIAETLIKPCAVDIAKCILDETSAKEITNVPLSNDTVARRIKDLAANVKAELISRLQCCNFSLQMDESTDVAGLAVLLVFARYQHLNLLEEDLLLCEPLPTNTTGAEIFNIVDNFFNTHGLDWKNCVDICTDGAKAMVGKTAGAVAKIKNLAPNCTNSHCILHRQALAVKKMPLSLKKVLDESVKIINFIKSRPLQTRLFKILCEDMGSVHKALLLHTEVRWLSRGKVLVRLFELRSELGTFFMKNRMDLQERLTDKLWLFRLGYLADIFSKINKVNMSLQGKQVTVFTANDKIQAFKKKLEVWITCIRSRELDSFTILKDFFDEINGDIDASDLIMLCDEICQHLEDILNSVKQYFPDEENEKLKNYTWIRNPFIVQKRPEKFTAKEYEIFIDMISDSSLQPIFEKLSLPEFWCTLREEYADLSMKAVKILLPFATTYLCESGFSSYAATKTKYRNRLNAEADMRIQLSSIKPEIKELCKNREQAHASH